MSDTPLVARATAPRATIVRIGGKHPDSHIVELGGRDFVVAAGPIPSKDSERKDSRC